jgi:hypothetical protein
MNRPLVYVLGILTLTLIVSFVVSANEIDNALNATYNNITSDTLNSSTSNNTLLNNTNSSNEELNQSLNLSTINSKPLALMNISKIAKSAPEVAATASSSQIAFEPVGSLRIGNAIGGWNPFNPEHLTINSTKIGLPIKPMRDTEKMFFVCDIV